MYITQVFTQQFISYLQMFNLFRIQMDLEHQTVCGLVIGK